MVTIQAGETSASFTVETFDDSIADGNQVAIISAVVNGFVSGTASVTVVDNETPTLALSLATNSIPENGGSVVGTVSRNTPTTTDLIINLSSSDVTAARVPNTVTILAGNASATFTVEAQDDLIADGDQLTTISVLAAGFVSSTTQVAVVDDEIAGLTLGLAQPSISEKGGSTSVTVTRNTPTTLDLTVNLSNSAPIAVEVPATVIIRAGASSALFIVNAIDNQIYNGNVSSRIRASASGYIESEVVLEIREDEPYHPWQNPLNHLDVSADGSVSPLDALLVINFLNSGRRGVLPMPKPGEFAPPPFVDVNGDDTLAPLDALLVINQLNKRGGGGEGEVNSTEERVISSEVDHMYFDTAWLDDIVAESRSRRARSR
jgi:hypothetical protein